LWRPAIIILKKIRGLGYKTAKLGETIVQAYADDMILVADSQQNLQIILTEPKVI
jgi:hypothetical protein